MVCEQEFREASLKKPAPQNQDKHIPRTNKHLVQRVLGQTTPRNGKKAAAAEPAFRGECV